MSYTVRVQVSGPGCDLNFSHHAEGREVADLARQFAALVAAGARGGDSSSSGPAVSLGGGVKVDCFRGPSSSFLRASRAAPMQRGEIEIRTAPKTSHKSAREAIFGSDEEIGVDDVEALGLGGGYDGARR